MNIKIVPVNRTYAVVVDGTKWRRFRRKADAQQFARDLQRDPFIFKPDLYPMKQRARCKRCGTEFDYIAGLVNSTYGGYPDFNEWPKCPSCLTYTETYFVKEA
jgi:hypothetical protein